MWDLETIKRKNALPKSVRARLPKKPRQKFKVGDRVRFKVPVQGTVFPVAMLGTVAVVYGSMLSVHTKGPWDAMWQVDVSDAQKVRAT